MRFEELPYWVAMRRNTKAAESQRDIVEVLYCLCDLSGLQTLEQ
jgi:hypothetical protein